MKFIFGFILLFGVNVFAQAKGILRVVKGDVQIRHGGDGALMNAQQGYDIGVSDAVITGEHGRASIELPGKNMINLSPNSNISIQEFENKQVSLHLIYGLLRAQVAQRFDGKVAKFQVITSSGIASLRGTDGLVSYDRDSKMSEVVALNGPIFFGQKGPKGQIINGINIEEGKMSRMEKGKPAQNAVAVGRDRLEQLGRETRLEHKEAKPFHMSGAGQHESNEKPDGLDRYGLIRLLSPSRRSRMISKITLTAALLFAVYMFAQGGAPQGLR